MGFYGPLSFILKINFILEVNPIKDFLINEQITVKELRVNYDGGTLGVVSLEEALQKAEEMNLDLVLISPVAIPPVAKIMNYGKYKFEFLKREKDAKKKQKITEIKGMQLGVNIADNDMNFKAKNVKKFLTAGDKVKVTLRLFRRQNANPQLGIIIMEKFATLVSDVGEVVSKPVLTGNTITMILSPKK